MSRIPRSSRSLAGALMLVGAALSPSLAAAQRTSPDVDSATVRLRILHDSSALASVAVRVGSISARSDALGEVSIRLPAGPATIRLSRIGFTPDSVMLSLRPGQDTAITIALRPAASTIESVIVSSTRAERRVEDTPLRVEVIDQEEVAEKVAMTPGDIAMMLNETSGLRVQTTSPSLGGANVRIQGLRGRYTLLLTDGLPLYGGQGSGLGLLQIPPVDLARVEVIKGTASALYGSSALGGVVNLVARRPKQASERELIVNQTIRGGTDGVLYLASPFGAASDDAPAAWSGSLLASAHRQRENDIDGDGWADMPGYRRAVLRPRLFFDRPGKSLFATLGVTSENREGGTVAGALAPDGLSYLEALRTHRYDAGITGRLVLDERDIVSIRASGMEQRHGHTFGPVRENDAHGTWFAEGSVAMPRERWTYVAGLAYQSERYRNADVAGFDFDFRTPGVFAQADFDATRWLVLSGSARADWHNVYGAVASPRVSVLARADDESALAGWTARLSGGTGTFAPVPFTEETEVTGLSALRPLGVLDRERAASGSFDLNGPLQTPFGSVELNASAYASRLTDAIAIREETSGGDTPSTLALVNAPLTSNTWGGELLARVVHGRARATATYAYLRATEWDPNESGAVRRPVPLAPRHTAGLVASYEEEEKSRVGLEIYYTGRQALDDNPYRTTSRPYVIVGLLGERWVETPGGVARVFLNLENIGNVRQTRYDRLVRPTKGPGGRWTTDAWTELSGFTMNGGVRLAF